MTKPKKFVFVLMPFQTDFDDIYTYGIKQTCTELNTYCERVDEQIFSERILDRIYNQIAKADIIIADMTSRNANVFYEVGYAHALGKAVVLLTQNADDIPFDLKHFPHIVYNGQIKTLSTQLKPRIEWFLNTDNYEEKQVADFGLEFFISGVKIEKGKEFLFIGSQKERHSQDEYDFSWKIDIYNSLSKIYKSRFKVGIELPISYNLKSESLEAVITPNNTIIFITEDISEIYPNAFKFANYAIKQKNDNVGVDTLPAILKIFAPYELQEIKFSISLKEEAGFMILSYKIIPSILPHARRHYFLPKNVA